MMIILGVVIAVIVILIVGN